MNRELIEKIFFAIEDFRASKISLSRFVSVVETTLIYLDFNESKSLIGNASQIVWNLETLNAVLLDEDRGANAAEEADIARLVRELSECTRAIEEALPLVAKNNWWE
jgi:hypothetical protein